MLNFINLLRTKDKGKNTCHLVWKPHCICILGVQIIKSIVQAITCWQTRQNYIPCLGQRRKKQYPVQQHITVKATHKGVSPLPHQARGHFLHVLVNDLNNYQPLDKPVVETTTKKAQQLIKTLLSEGHTGLEITIGQAPDTLSGQTWFCSDTDRHFWPDKFNPS